MKRSKYNNKRTGGYDSKREADFGAKLELMRKATRDEERVTDIQRQVRYTLIPSQRGADGGLIERKCDYIADFVVTFTDGRQVVYDVKGFRTPDYIIKRKLMLKVHGIRIVEV